MLVSEELLDEWVRAHPRDAQSTIVELAWRLVAAASPNPRERRFPLGGSIGQHGPDGVLVASVPFEPFVPDGRSIWEIGTGLQAGRKATDDYKTRVADTPPSIRSESTFVFVTPLSAVRDWPHTWKAGDQGDWLDNRRQRRDWKDVRVVDGTKLTDWLQQFPAVELWLAERMGHRVQQLETLDHRWSLLRSIGEPPQLVPELFLANRDAACAKLREVFFEGAPQLRLDTHYPEQVADFVAAYIATLDEERRADAVGRCIIAGGADAWDTLCTLRDSHVLVASFDLDEAEAQGTMLLQKARRARHAVILGGLPGGIPHPNRVAIPSPKTYQIKECLEKAGYKDERARVLAQRSDGNLSSLLRCLQNLSISPDWAHGDVAADLGIAELLGSWNEKSPADRSAIEGISGKAYGEWIGRMRDLALRPGTPLVHRDGAWKVVARYEGWYALGRTVFDDVLDRLVSQALNVLREADPKFELPDDQRFAAALHGKSLSYSRSLRRGIAETLALLGAHPDALTQCSARKAEGTAALVVRNVLKDANWILWATLRDLLPLLAEAAPVVFMDAVDVALSADPCPFDELFAQEGAGIAGDNYMTGVLWALETLAWDPDHLPRVVMQLGELAARDPGGKWSNRPANSLSTILLPWLPQTCASVSSRYKAVESLTRTIPPVGWKVLLSLLPETHGTSMGTRRPAWRATIADEWNQGVKRTEYWAQVGGYTDLAIQMAESDLARLAELVDRLDDIPPPAYERLVRHLRSAAITSLPEADRLDVWTKVVDLATRHRKFAQADWAMPPDKVEQLWETARLLEPKDPTLRYRRLFSDRGMELYEETGNFEQQAKNLDDRRRKAVMEILQATDTGAVLQFARSVDSPWRVGTALGMAAEPSVDSAFLPDLLLKEDRSGNQFVAGLVLGRFHTAGWPWADALLSREWSPPQVGQFLAYLPFVPETWQRAGTLLGAREAEYWTRTHANPYDATTGLEAAAARLLDHNRPIAATRILSRLRYDNHPTDAKLVVKALTAALSSNEGQGPLDADEYVQLIRALQSDPAAEADDLFRIEWAYLPLLDGHHGAAPQHLGQRLGNDPAFFCEVIRLVFRSKKEEKHRADADDAHARIATNAYRLLTNWRTPPGTTKEAPFDGQALRAWVQAVEAQCETSGHLEIARTMFGHVLFYAPPDPGGLWIHSAAATVLDAKDAEDVRIGYRTEAYNSRGVHWVDPSGSPERALALDWRNKAILLDESGYHRFANAVRGLALEHEQDAERVVAETTDE